MVFYGMNLVQMLYFVMVFRNVVKILNLWATASPLSHILLLPHFQHCDPQCLAKCKGHWDRNGVPNLTVLLKCLNKCNTGENDHTYISRNLVWFLVDR
jgi:hypothetical protein